MFGRISKSTNNGFTSLLLFRYSIRLRKPKKFVVFRWPQNGKSRFTPFWWRIFPSFNHLKNMMISVFSSLHRKCNIRIFICELQNFGKWMSERSEQVSFPQFCNHWIKTCTKHLLCCNLFIVYIVRIKHILQISFIFSR